VDQTQGVTDYERTCQDFHYDDGFTNTMIGVLGSSRAPKIKRKLHHLKCSWLRCPQVPQAFLRNTRVCHIGVAFLMGYVMCKKCAKLFTDEQRTQWAMARSIEPARQPASQPASQLASQPVSQPDPDSQPLYWSPNGKIIDLDKFTASQFDHFLANIQLPPNGPPIAPNCPQLPPNSQPASQRSKQRSKKRGRSEAPEPSQPAGQAASQAPSLRPASQPASQPVIQPSSQPSSQPASQFSYIFVARTQANQHH